MWPTFFGGRPMHLSSKARWATCGEAGATPLESRCGAWARVPAGIANARARSVAAPIANRELQKSTSGGRKCSQLFFRRAARGGPRAAVGAGLDQDDQYIRDALTISDTKTEPWPSSRRKAWLKVARLR